MLHPVGGLLILLLVLAPLILWRAGLETSLWMDEIYTLLLTSYPVGRLIELTGMDAHPPGYYLALDVWLKVARAFPLEPGLLWARLLNVGAWAGLAATAWLAGRRLLGGRAGVLLAWAVGSGAGAALMARELRGYGLAAPLLFAAFLVLVAVAMPAMAERSRARLRWSLWTLYALCATAALWIHLLTALVLAASSAAWLILAAARRQLRPPLRWRTLAPALVAHGLPVLLFSPWLLRVRQQVAYLEGSDPGWMTPPSAENLLWVFTFWYPFGRIGMPSAEGNLVLVPLGIAAVLLPATVAATWLLRSRRREPPAEDGADRGCGRRSGAAGLAVIGLGGSVLFVLATWTLDRFGWAPVFHGPRYPLLAVHLWIAGLVGLVVWAAAHRRARSPWVLAAFVPWLLACAVGQVRLARSEGWGELSEIRAAAGPAWPAAGEALYLVPSELVPFYRGAFDRLDLRRVERLPCAEGGGSSAAILEVNPWRQLDRPRDHLVRALLAAGRLGEEVWTVAFPPGRPTYTFHRVRGLDAPLLAELCRRGLEPPLRDRIAGSVSEAMPADQLPGEEWSYVEVSPDLEVYRWATSPRVHVQFDRPLPEGRYTLHVVGSRAPRAEPGFRVELPGAGLQAERSVPPGRFHLCFEIDWRRGGRTPSLAVEHPVWRSPGPDAQAAGDARSLSFLLYGAWLTPEGPDAAGGCGAW